MKKLIVALSVSAGLILISYVFRLNFVYILVIATLVLICYYYLDLYFNKEHDEEFIEKKLSIANKELIKAPNTIILIIKDKKVLWGNDLSYLEFPELRESRDISNISLDNIKDHTFTHNNQIYYVKGEDGLYFIENITERENELTRLKNKQANIAVLYIDNFNYLEERLSSDNFGSVIRDLRIDLLRFFDSHNIFYQEYDGEKYQLLIPDQELKSLIESKFSGLFDVFKKYQTNEYTFSYSMGVALNQPNVRATGYKAMEALDLAKSRGGAQTVIFDGEKRIIFGGGVSTLQGSTLMKARLMYQTILNIIKNKQHIYLMGHKNPDSDCIASMALMAKLIRDKYSMPITIIIDDDYQYKLFPLIEGEKDIYVNNEIEVRIDRSLLMVLDTQSLGYISNPQGLDLVGDIIIVDHHQTPDDAITNPVTKWIEPSLSSVVEMVLQMFLISQTKVDNKALATYALYGVLIDTNYLTYRVSETTLDVVKNLVNSGASMLEAKKKTFDEFDEFKLLNSLTSEVNKVNIFSVVNVENVKDNVILSKVADAILEIKGIKASIVISNVDYKYYVKMRSMGDINVKLFLEEFGGGGHASQAACIINHEQYLALINKIKNYQIKE